MSGRRRRLLPLQRRTMGEPVSYRTDHRLLIPSTSPARYACSHTSKGGDMPNSSVVSGILGCAVLVACGTAIAQDEGQALDTITVTGSNITYRDLLDTPAVSVTRPGDFLLLPITLVNDTRSEDGRKREIYATIEKMMGATGKLRPHLRRRLSAAPERAELSDSARQGREAPRCRQGIPIGAYRDQRQARRSAGTHARPARLRRESGTRRSHRNRYQQRNRAEPWRDPNATVTTS